MEPSSRCKWLKVWQKLKALKEQERRSWQWNENPDPLDMQVLKTLPILKIVWFFPVKNDDLIIRLHTYTNQEFSGGTASYLDWYFE